MWRLRRFLAVPAITVAAVLAACGDADSDRPAATSQTVPGSTTTAATSQNREPSVTGTASSVAPATGSSAPSATATPGPSRTATALDTELIAAASRGDTASITRLLAAGASVRARGPGATTALIAAAYALQLEAAELLIAAGADVNEQDSSRQGAYLIATSEVGDSDRALALLRLTLRNGADVRTLDSYNGTGLIRAADRGYVEIVKELLSTTTDVNHINNLGWTALLEAVILGRGDARHAEVVRALVASGADVNLADRAGVTPLAHARQRGYSEMVAILEAAGAR